MAKKIMDDYSKELYCKFEDYLTLRKRANTVKQYITSVSLFYEYVKKPLIEVIDDDIIRWQNYMTDYKELEVSTANSRLNGVKMFYEFLTERELIKKSPLTKDVKPKIDPRDREVRFLRVDEVNSILSAVEFDVKNEDDFVRKVRLIRDSAIIHILAYSGFRIGEVSNLKVIDIDIINNVIRAVNDKNRKTKSKKNRIVEISPKCSEAVKRYLDVRKRLYDDIDVKDDGFLFVSNSGLKLSTKTANDLVKRYATRGGLMNPSEVTPHTFRHTFASVIYSQEKDMVQLSQKMGHSKTSTTELYVGLFEKNESVSSKIDFGNIL